MIIIAFNCDGKKEAATNKIELLQKEGWKKIDIVANIKRRNTLFSKDAKHLNKREFMDAMCAGAFEFVGSNVAVGNIHGEGMYFGVVNSEISEYLKGTYAEQVIEIETDQNSGDLKIVHCSEFNRPLMNRIGIES